MARKRRNQGQPNQDRPGRLAPYHFVPVRPELTPLDAPVFHDQQPLDEKLLSGEIDLEIRCLTPLLAANDAAYLGPRPDGTGPDGQEKGAVCGQTIREQAMEFLRSLTPHWNGQPPHDAGKKRLLQPLLEPAAEGVGKVLIPGSQLKGMLRQSLSALLSAPMERVCEQTFSYRPLMSLANGQKNVTHYVGRVVDDPQSPSGKAVECYPIERAVFVGELRNDEQRKIDKRVGQIDQLQLASVRFQKSGDVGPNNRRARSNKLFRIKGASTFDRRVLVLAARQGLDGQGLFGAEFGTGRSRGYTRVLILDPPNPVRLTLSQEIQEHYRRTLEHLRDNEHGHLRKHPKAPDQRNARRHIKAMLDSCFPADTAFFLEVRGNKILSIGHHFRYRWRYRDTVRTVNMQERVEVKPLEDERETDNEGKPRHLAPNRSLFGYVSTERAERHENEPATAGIGEGDFKQLAGRIAFNFAVEQITKKKTGQPKSLAGRFLNADAGCFVALKVLGSPKPSACEHYLEQSQFSKRKDNGVYCSYGDTLDDPVEASLAGRKFYLHQRRGKWNWQPGQTEDRQGKSRFSDLSALARYVLKDGSRLRCRLRFINLRPWELGALLIALELRADEVDRFVEEIDKSSDGWTWHLEQAQANGTDKKPRYAHKLGHARPLGLGSVVFQADALRIFDRNAEWVEVDQRQRATYVEAFAKRLKDHGQMDAWFSSVFVPFCEVHRFSGVKREALNYPTAHDKRNGETIVKYHSTLRGNHIKGRQQAKNGQREPSGLPRLVALEPQR